MTKEKEAQKWFNNKGYSKAKKEKIGIKANIKGPLKIEGFTKLKSIKLKQLKLTSLEINNCSQLSNIDLSELIKLKSLSISDCPGITKLDLSQSKLTELTELEVSNLDKLNCSNTSIEKLSLNLCPNIVSLDCSKNEKLIYLDITNCSKLGTLILDDKSKLTSLDLSNCPKIKDSDLPSNLKIIREKKIKNILIIGRTGGGKSTLSNVITGTDEFEESASAVSVTKNFQKKVFEWPDTADTTKTTDTDTTKTTDTTKYRVVDTIGVGDTNLTKRQVLYKIAEGIYSMPEGISQVLFVIHGRFTAEEIESFNLFGKSILGNDVLKYITIVKTKFVNFKNKEECDKEREKLLRESETIADVIKSCRGIVFVDNPPTKMIINDDDDKGTVENNKRVRKKSRELLLEYLGNVGQEKFKLKTWDEIHAKIADYINKNPDKEITEDTEDLIDENNPEIRALLIFGTKICSIL